mgnify:CR=1 FL=1
MAQTDALSSRTELRLSGAVRPARICGTDGVHRLWLAAEQPVPVVPVVMIDTERIMPIGAKRPVRGSYGIVFGEPIDFSEYRNMPADRFVLRAITDRIMSEIAALSDQEYADVYASTLRKKLDAARR